MDVQKTKMSNGKACVLPFNGKAKAKYAPTPVQCPAETDGQGAGDSLCQVSHTPFPAQPGARFLFLFLIIA